jgi:hypothetical protein
LDNFKKDKLLENNEQFEIDFNGLTRRQIIKKIIACCSGMVASIEIFAACNIFWRFKSYVSLKTGIMRFYRMRLRIQRLCQSLSSRILDSIFCRKQLKIQGKFL